MPTGQGRILLVDDEPMVADVCRQMIEQMGYQTTAFTDSRRALDAFQAHPGHFDLLVTDLTMPGLTGDRLAREIRRKRPDMPILLISGNATERRGGDLNVLCDIQVIGKPLSSTELGNALSAALNQRVPRGGEMMIAVNP